MYLRKITAVLAQMGVRYLSDTNMTLFPYIYYDIGYACNVTHKCQKESHSLFMCVFRASVLPR